MTVVTPARTIRTIDATSPSLLIVVDAESPGETSLRRAAAIATTLECPVEVLLVYRRIGFTTDAALVASAKRYRNQQLERAVEVLSQLLPDHPPPEARMRPYTLLPLGDCTEQARRAIRAATRDRRHRMVMTPPRLAQRPDSQMINEIR